MTSGRTVTCLALAIAVLGTAKLHADNYPANARWYCPYTQDGACGPNSRYYGFYETRWRKWPEMPRATRHEPVPTPAPIKKSGPTPAVPSVDELPPGEPPSTDQGIPPLDSDIVPPPPSNGEPGLPPDLGGDLPQLPQQGLDELVPKEPQPKQPEPESSRPEPPKTDESKSEPTEPEPEEPKKIPNEEDPFKDDPLPDETGHNRSRESNREIQNGPALSSNQMRWKAAARFRAAAPVNSREQRKVVVDTHVMRASALSPVHELATKESSSTRSNPLRSGNATTQANPLRPIR